MRTETGLFSLRDGPAARPARRRERSERVPVGAARPLFSRSKRGHTERRSARNSCTRIEFSERISVAGRSLLSVCSLSQQDTDFSLRGSPTKCRRMRRCAGQAVGCGQCDRSHRRQGGGLRGKTTQALRAGAGLKDAPFTTPYNPRKPVNTHSSDHHFAGAANSSASAGRSLRNGASASLSDRMGSRTGQSIARAGSFQRMLRSAFGTYTSVHL